VEITSLTPGDDLLDVPERCCFLALAATREEARGRGIGTMLTAHGLREAHAEGYVVSLTDWRITNLQASRLWPRLGFRPFQYRLHRLIDDRIAWAYSFPE
jgi:ribosomal protein S18 acetylase RimI-like enzyme